MKRYRYGEQWLWLLSDVADALGRPASLVARMLRRWDPRYVDEVAAVSIGLRRPGTAHVVTAAGVRKLCSSCRPTDSSSRRGVAELEAMLDRMLSGPAWTVERRVARWPGLHDVLPESALSAMGRLAAARHRQRYGCDPERVHESSGRSVYGYRGPTVQVLDEAIRVVLAEREAAEELGVA